MHRARTLAATLVGVCLIVLFAAPARAQRTYDFVTDQSSYTVLPNGTVAVSVFLRETIAGSSTSQLVSEDGLFSAVAQATRTTSPTDPARITAAARNTSNYDGISDTSVVAGGAQANVGGSRSFDHADPGSGLPQGGTPVIADSATVRRVNVGTITIQAGLIPLQTSTFTLADRPNTSDTLTWTTGVQLDALLTPRTFTVTVLPEPAAAGFLGLGGLLLMRRVRRR